MAHKLPGGGLVNPLSYFPQTYSEAIVRFQCSLEQVGEFWPEAQLQSRRVSFEDESLAIHWIEAEAVEQPRKRLILTTGQHGIEGYMGAAILLMFLMEFLPHLDPRDTGLLLLHPINPWGMKYNRRTNQNNVDLNRNCTSDELFLAQHLNPDYSRLDPLLNPQKPLNNLKKADLQLFSGLVRELLFLGGKGFQKAALLGQHRFSQGLYYGGEAVQEENRVLQELLRRQLAGYEHAVHIDIHTGYGPRYSMQLINSPLEKRSSKELSQRFAYPNVLQANPKEFYSISGDLIDYVYNLARDEFPQLNLYATAFEFGTFGDSLSNLLRSLRVSVYENQLFWHSSQNEQLKGWVQNEYRELFYPREVRWRQAALNNARAAFEGILRAERLTG
jgi:hypothetical protein